MLLGALVLSLLSAQTDSQSLLGRWQLDRSHVRGKTVKDLAGRLPGTFTATPTFDKTSPRVAILDAKRHVLLAAQPSKDLLPEERITVESWVRVDKAQEWGGLIGFLQDNGSYERGWLLGFNHAHFAFAVSSRPRNRLTYLKASRAFEPGSWYHVVGTYDGAEQRLYVDGRLAASDRTQKGPISYPPKGTYVLGAYRDENELYPLAGRIEQASVWARVLSEKEIRARFESRKRRFPGIEPETVEVVDWPTYRRDNRRSGMAGETPRFPLRVKWIHQPRHAPQPAWPEPARQDFWHRKTNLKARVVFDRAFHVVTVGDRVYFGSSSEDKVTCLDAETGSELWTFFTEGPVRLAPTVAGDRVLFGSDDGYVYCVRAKDGTLDWKTRGGPEDRRIAGNQRIISAWPVRSGVLVDGDSAHFCAGLFPGQGVLHVAVDLGTGRKRGESRVDRSAQGYMERRGGRLFISTGRDPAGSFVSSLERKGKSAGKEVSRLPAEYPFSFIGAGEVRFGGGDGKVAAFDARNGKKIWEGGVEGKAYSLAIARGRLYVGTDRGWIYRFDPEAGEARTVSPSPPIDRAASVEARAWADRILGQTSARKGYALLLDGGAPLARELARRSELKIVVATKDAGNARRELDEAGLYGRVVVHELAKISSLPYTDYLFNVIVAPSAAPRGDLERVLRPLGGVALFGKEVVRRGPVKGAGDWTHLYANAANTVCSEDRKVGSRLQLQWFGLPGPRTMIDRHHRTVGPVSTNGRLFVPGNDRVFGVDAYNGALLWEREVPEFKRVAAFRDCGSMAATDRHLYVASGAQCRVLDAATGKESRTFQVPRHPDGKPREWGYLAVVGDVLFASAVKPGASRREQNREVAATQTFWDFVPLVGSDAVFALDRHTGRTLWHYAAQSGLLVNPTLTVAEGRVYFVESTNSKTLDAPKGRAKASELLGRGSNVVALDAATGRSVWKRSHDLSAIQHNVYIAAAKGKLVVVGSRNSGTDKKKSTVFYDIHALDAATGRKAWFRTQNQLTAIGGDHGEQDHHPVIVGDRLYCEPYAYDLKRGTPIEDWGWTKAHRRGCGTISASSSTFYFRNKTATMFDLERKEARPVTTSTRPGCWINMIPAGGLLLIPEASSGCTCDFAVQASLAFLPMIK